MPWLAIDYSEDEIKDLLNDKYDVQGVPSFVLVDGDSCEMIQADARSALQYKDKEGNDFPWKDKKFD